MTNYQLAQAWKARIASYLQFVRELSERVEWFDNLTDAQIEVVLSHMRFDVGFFRDWLGRDLKIARMEADSAELSAERAREWMHKETEKPDDAAQPIGKAVDADTVELRGGLFSSADIGIFAGKRREGEQAAFTMDAAGYTRAADAKIGETPLSELYAQSVGATLGQSLAAVPNELHIHITLQQPPPPPQEFGRPLERKCEIFAGSVPNSPFNWYCSTHDLNFSLPNETKRPEQCPIGVRNGIG